MTKTVAKIWYTYLTTNDPDCNKNSKKKILILSNICWNLCLKLLKNIRHATHTHLVSTKQIWLLFERIFFFFRLKFKNFSRKNSLNLILKCLCWILALTGASTMLDRRDLRWMSKAQSLHKRILNFAELKRDENLLWRP